MPLHSVVALSLGTRKVLIVHNEWVNFMSVISGYQY